MKTKTLLAATSAVVMAAFWLASPAALAGAHGDELAAFKAAIRAQYDLKERAFAEDNPDLVVDGFYSAVVFRVDVFDVPRILECGGIHVI